MTHPKQTRPNYVAVWAWLVVLLMVSLAAAYLPFPQAATISVIFTVAVVKALLVAANFMHLRFEQRLIRAIAIVPVLLFLALTLALMPDIVFNR